MVHSPSKKWENGRLVERAISNLTDGDPEEVDPKATRPYKAPVPTRNEVNRKMVDTAENKAVAKASTKTKKAAKK